MDLKSYDQESQFVAYHQWNYYYLENAIKLVADVYDTNSLINVYGQECTEIKVLVSATAFSESVTPPTDHYYNGYGIRLSSSFSSRDNDAPPGIINVNTGHNYGTNTTGDNWYNQNEGDTPNIGFREIMTAGASLFVDHFTGYPISGLPSHIFDYCGASKSTLGGHATDFHEETFVEFQNVIGYNAVDSSYQAATVFSFEMPHDSREYSLHISATNLIGSWLQGSPTNNVQNILDSAEASIIINIYNGEIQSIDSHWLEHASSNTINIGTSNGHRNWYDYVEAKVNRPNIYYIYTLSTNQPDPRPIPKLDLSIDWGDGSSSTVENWEPYSTSYDGYTTFMGIRRHKFINTDNEYHFTHTYNLNNHGISPGGSKTFTISITAESLPEYGGWIVCEEYDITINYLQSGGSGGGCPYVSVWNGTGYQRDNNLLIASEHEYGIVEDNYLLEVPLVPKDGFYSMKIEEFQTSESYFDEVKLYTVDHPEGYRVAVTPTGELISFSENPSLKSSDTTTLAGEPIDTNIIDDLDESLYMVQDSVLTMHFTNISEISDLSEQYVILRSHGYESHESVPDLGLCSIDRWWYAHIKAIGRYEPVRLMGNETTYFDEEYIYPRNHPYYLAVPLPEGLEDGADELIFNISYSGDHYLQFVALTKSVNHSVYVQEAELAKAVFNGEFNVTNRLLETDNDMVKLIPGDEILLNFNIPDPIGEDMERSYMISSVGYYEPYLGRHPTAHNDGSERWSFATQGSVQSSPKVGQDGMIYVGSDDTHLYAVNPDGTVEWSFATDGSLRSSPMIGHDGTIYVGSDDNSLYAVNPDGTERWNFTTGGSITTSPVLSINGTIYMSSTDGYLYAVNPDGTEMWSLNAGDGTTPTIGWNGTIYFGTNSCSDFAFLMSVTPDGYDTRLFTTEGNITTSPAIGWDGTIYFGTEYDRLYAVNPNGTERWNFTATGPIRSTPILSMDGTIYFGSDDGRLYAVNSNGTERWNFTTAAPISSSPSISSEGFVYVGSDDGMLYAIDPDGTEIWSFGTEGAVRSSPRIARDGAIYVGSNDNKLYSIGPYVISYIEQLQMIENDLSANYVLVNDIDASYTVGWNSGDGFAPIGTLEDRFTGTFDGRGYTISGLYIDRPSESGVGLFGNIGADGVVSDVGLVDVDITGSGRVGGLAGRNYGTVSDTYVTGNVSGGGEGIGGLVGFMHTSSLYNSYSTADVSGGTAWVLNNPFGTPNRGFSLTNVQYASWTYTHVHEMGHNMGASHHKEQNVQPGPGLYAFPAQPIMDILIDDIK